MCFFTISHSHLLAKQHVTAITSLLMSSFDYAKFESNLSVPSMNLDAGAQGTIFVAIDTSEPDAKLRARYALKRYYNLNVRREQEEYLRELTTMLDINHPALVPLIHFNIMGLKNDHVPYLLFPFFQKKSLHLYVETPSGKTAWNNTTKMINMIGIACGTKYLHANGIVHRDLKPENILMDDLNYPHLSDFGLAMRLSQDGTIPAEKAAENKGTYYLVAPELFTGLVFGPKVDVYAYSGYLYWIFTGKYPFEECEGNFAELEKVVCSDKRPDVSSVPQPFQDIIKRGWAVNPDDRPTMAEIVDILSNPKSWLPGCDEQELKEYLIMMQETAHIKLDDVPNPFTGGDIKNAEDAFKAIDKDNSGTLDLGELREFLRSHCPTLRLFARVLMQLFGTDGKITWEKFVELYDAFRVDSNDERYIAKRVFDHMDDDRSGSIDYNEMRGFIDLIDAPRSIVQGLVTKLNKITYDQFKMQFHSILVFVSKSLHVLRRSNSLVLSESPLAENK